MNTKKAIIVLAISMLFIVSTVFMTAPYNQSQNSMKTTTVVPTIVTNVPAHLLNLSTPDQFSNNSSTIVTSPPPIIPNTTPIVYNLVQNWWDHKSPAGSSSSSKTIYVEGNFTAPATPAQGWALILLNFTGAAKGIVYDTSYSFFVDNTMLMYGTSPEYGTWTVLKDVTLYDSLFVGNVSWLFHPPATIVNGSYYANVTLSFYPANSQYPAPAEPNMIVPVFGNNVQWGAHLTPSKNYYTINNITVPNNTQYAVLQMMIYGFGMDEFWYTNTPAYRGTVISVNDTNTSFLNISEIQPFPYINTGGINLFSWRPVTAVFTTNDRFYMENLTPALGFIEHTHTWNITVTDIYSGSYWMLTGSLLLYTNVSIVSATPVAYHWVGQKSVQVGTGNPYYNQTVGLLYGYASQFNTNTVSYVAQLNAIEYFYNTQFYYTAGSSTSMVAWENLTQYENMQITTGSESLNAYNMGVPVPVNTVSSYSYPLTMQTGEILTITPTTNGSYPEYGSITIILNNCLQAWQENNTNLLEPLTNVMVNNSVFTTNGYTVGNIEMISSSAGLISGLTYVSAVTTKTDMQSNVIPDYVWTYGVTASSLYNYITNSTNPNYVETVYINQHTLTVPIDILITVQAELTNAELKISNLQELLASANTTIATLITDLASANATIKSLNVQVSTLWAEYNASKTLNAQLNMTLANDKATINTMTQQISTMNGEIKSLTTMVNNKKDYYSPVATLGIAIGLLIVGIVAGIGTMYLVYHKKPKTPTTTTPPKTENNP
jgi:hypothetical protein